MLFAISYVLVAALQAVSGFVVMPRRLIASSSPSLLALHAKHKQKLSMAEKRKQRAKKVSLHPPMTGKPVDFSSKASTSKQEELTEAQQATVGMLNHVKARVQDLPAQDIKEALSTKGYYVVDGFLDNQDIVSQLQEEGKSMLDNGQMEEDPQDIGYGEYGEYVVRIVGEEEQYTYCPRMVELAVSLAEHMPHVVNDKLDSTKVMTTLHTYGGDTELEMIEEQPPRLWTTVATSSDDPRELTLMYYPVSKEWDALEDKGGLTFAETGEAVAAKRDRLVLLDSRKCLHRREAWHGNEGLHVASAVELHFIKKQED